MKKTICGSVKGRVQGVGFRYFTQEQAVAIELSGFVFNRDDGAVEFVVQGEENQIQQFIEKLKQGPRFARVDSLDWQEINETEYFDGFVIRY